MMLTPDPCPLQSVTKDQVVAYLHCHADFLWRYSEPIAIPPSRLQAGKVVDLQYCMIDRLREVLNSLHGCVDKLLQATRSNMSTQEQTHQAVLALVGVDSFVELHRTVIEDLPTLLSVYVIAHCAGFGIRSVFPGHAGNVFVQGRYRSAAKHA